MTSPTPEQMRRAQEVCETLHPWMKDIHLIEGCAASPPNACAGCDILAQALAQEAEDARVAEREKAAEDGRYLPSHAVMWSVVNGRVCRQALPHTECEREVLVGADVIVAVLAEAGMQAHKVGCANRLTRPGQWDERKPCAGCAAEAAIRGDKS